ncbi:unnamed protein product [marine sediment metagenome]|uniref:Zinc-ribbon domain-containing protein n=1 Tax=marine sediment metagenome TaxID=412755 RepID=X1CKF0_9ZZZZ
MDYCIRCGAKLPEKAEFCNKCGKPLKSSNEPKKEIKDKKSIEEKIEETAEEIGKKAEQIGKRIEKKADDVGNHVNEWYDKTFKIAGPLIGAFIGLIVIRIIIYVIQVSGEDIFIATSLGEGLNEYLLIIFVSMLLSGYNTYFNRKYRYQYQWIYPLISAIGFIIGAWIASQIMIIISQSNNTPIIEAIGTFINTYIIGIFILALIIGYAVQFTYATYISQEK